MNRRLMEESAFQWSQASERIRRPAQLPFVFVTTRQRRCSNSKSAKRGDCDNGNGFSGGSRPIVSTAESSALPVCSGISMRRARSKYLLS